MHKIKILPRNDNTNGWSKIIKQRIPSTHLQEDLHVDWVIVGGGLAGLAAARRLAEHRPSDKIAILEAGVVGEGAQGRNSGFAIDIPHNVGSSVGELNHAQRHLRLARSAISYLKAQVDKYNIDCDWSETGKFHAAVSTKGIENILLPTLQTLESLNEPFEWLQGAKLHETLGFKHFNAAIYTPGTVLLNPAALCHGLANNLPSNVLLYENTPVTHFSHKPSIIIKTPHAYVRANKMILTVNAFTEQFGVCKERLIPIAAHASLSRPLNTEEQKALSGLNTWGLTPANAFVGITMRRTNDQRILIRQHMEYEPKLYKTDKSRERVKQQHQKLFNERFPMLPNVTMEHTWTGMLCISRNGTQGFGLVAPNIYVATCQNGAGLTKGTYAGMLIADKACNIQNPLIEDIEAMGSPSRLPPRPFLDAGIRVRFAWELWQARHEA